MKSNPMNRMSRLACLLGIVTLGLVRASAADTSNASSPTPATGEPITSTPAPTPKKTTPATTNNKTAPSSQAPASSSSTAKPTTTVVESDGKDGKDIVAVPAEHTGWLDQKYMLGDWGGERTKLADKGVVFSFNNIEDLQSDVTGGQTHHVAEFGRFRASLDVDLNKLAKWDGEFFISGIWQYGRNLSADYLNVNTLTSSIAGTESLRLDQAWYQQGLADSRIKIKAGQIAIVNDFGATDFGDILFNDELGYAPNPIFQSQQPFSPAGKPAVEVKLDLRDVMPGLYAKAAAYTAYTNAYRPDDNGFHYGDDFDHGVGYAAELGYVEQKAQYAGTYKVGTNINDLSHYQSYDVFNPVTGAYSGTAEQGNYTFYALAEKALYHPDKVDGSLDTAKGLDAYTEFTYAPGDRNLLEYEVDAGLRYTGPFSSRPKDKVGAGFILSQAGDHASDAFSAATGQGHLQSEETFELDYQYHLADWFLIQPDLQYIVDPRGDMNRQDILVLGLRTVVTF